MTEDTASTMEETAECNPISLEDLTADEFFALSAEEQEVLVAGRGRPKKKAVGAAGDPKKDEKIPEVHDAQELCETIHHLPLPRSNSRFNNQSRPLQLTLLQRHQKHQLRLAMCGILLLPRKISPSMEKLLFSL